MAAPIYKKKDAAQTEERADKDTDTEAEERATQSKVAKDETPGADAADEAASPHERHLTERKEMFGRHESETRDHHGNHREAVKQMHARQQKERRDMDARHLLEIGSGNGDEQAPAAAPAEG